MLCSVCGFDSIYFIVDTHFWHVVVTAHTVFGQSPFLITSGLSPSDSEPLEDKECIQCSHMVLYIVGVIQ